MSTEVEYSSRKRAPRASTGQSVVVTASVPRTRMSMGPGTSMMQRTNVMSSRGFVPTRPAGEVAALSKKSVQNVKETRNKEKGDLSGLNQKLAEQMETYRYLQGMVKQCQMETEKWKKMRMFDDTKLKEIIADEIDELRDALAKEKEKVSKLEAEKLKWEEKYDTLIDDLTNLKKDFDNLLAENEKLKNINCGLESEASLLRKDMEFKDAEIKRRQDHEADLADDANRLRDDLESARVEQLKLSDDLNRVTDEFAFFKDCKTEECNELQRIIKHMQSAEPDYSRMWTGQFKETIQKLQEETDQRINQHMADMQRSYDTKLAKIQAGMKRDEPDGISRAQTNVLKSQMTEKDRKLSDLAAENDKLRRQIEELERKYREECEECERDKAKLRDDLHNEKCEKEDIEMEMKDLEQTNYQLSQEIATYASLLNAGAKDLAYVQGNYQSLGGATLSQAIMGGGGGGAGGAGGYGSGGGSGGGMSSSQQSTMSESSGRMTVTKTSKIGITIDELSWDGATVRIVNTASKDIDLSKFMLKRTYTDRDKREKVSTFEFKSGILIKRGEKMTIFSALFEDDKKENDLVGNPKDCKTWGTGTGNMKLLDRNGDTVASYIMKMNA